MAHEDRDPRATRRGGVVLPEGRLTDGREPPADEAGGSPAAPRLRLRPSIEVFPASTGDIHLLSPGEADRVVREPDAVDRALIDRLSARGATREELAAHLAAIGLRARGDEVEGKLTALLRAGVAVERAPARETLSDEARARFDRQLPYFEERGDPEVAQRALADATVLVLGCGGLGTWALAGLASAGVGAFVLVDPDRVEPSNLNRQILFGERSVGLLKVDEARAWLEGFDRTTSVRVVAEAITSPARLEPLVTEVDVVVMAADHPPYDLMRWVDEACVRAGVPYVTAGQVPPLLKIGPTYLPGETACFACHERGLEAEFPLYAELADRRRERPSAATTLGPASGIVGEMVAMEVVHLLVGHRPLATEGRAVFLDMRGLSSWSEAIARRPDCPRCGHLADGDGGAVRR